MREKINNYYEKVVASLRDAYYRIGVVDLNRRKPQHRSNMIL